MSRALGFPGATSSSARPRLCNTSRLRACTASARLVGAVAQPIVDVEARADALELRREREARRPGAETTSTSSPGLLSPPLRRVLLGM